MGNCTGVTVQQAHIESGCPCNHDLLPSRRGMPTGRTRAEPRGVRTRCKHRCSLCSLRSPGTAIGASGCPGHRMSSNRCSMRTCATLVRTAWSRARRREAARWQRSGPPEAPGSSGRSAGPRTGPAAHGSRCRSLAGTLTRARRTKSPCIARGRAAETMACPARRTRSWPERRKLASSGRPVRT